ncbi:HupA family protein [Qipengyuania gaetbuli]|uniref:hypothetical protein n=1 Tax=Qipengyuania gaetbuli TaxID=266952 RepID=UPI00147942CE|nr:hypothetical protein [Qipengyuania gaetbuli]
MSSEPLTVLGVVNEYAPGADGVIQVSPHERADISLEYRASDGAYFITLPGYNRGALYTTGYHGSYIDGSAWQNIYGTYNQLLDGESGRQDAFVYLAWPKGPLSTEDTLTYTSWGNWEDDGGLNGKARTGNYGYFAYGIPTTGSDVPKTGTASYSADIKGTANYNYDPNSLYVDYVTGTAELRFDFGAGTLAGEMNPWVCPWDCYPIGTYTFVETVYASGSTVFSGKFARDGTTLPSWFEGNFNGPGAAELMARFSAPYVTTIEGREYSGTIGGIWIGRKN